MPDADVQIPESSLTCLTFAVGHSRCALDVRRVLYIAEYRDEARKLPGAPPGMLGLMPAQDAYVPLHDLSALISVVSHGVETRELIQTMDAREQDHVAWIEALGEALRNGTPFQKTTDPHACAFGRWYDGFRTDDEELAETLKLFDEPHRTIHALGARLLGLAAEGHRDDALKALRIEGMTTLNHLRAVFRLARERLASNIRPVTILIADDGGRPEFAWLVDGIHEVCEFSTAAIHPAEAWNAQLPASGLVRGMLQGGDGDFLWLDPAAAARAGSARAAAALA